MVSIFIRHKIKQKYLKGIPFQGECQGDTGFLTLSNKREIVGTKDTKCAMKARKEGKSRK